MCLYWRLQRTGIKDGPWYKVNYYMFTDYGEGRVHKKTKVYSFSMYQGPNMKWVLFTGRYEEWPNERMDHGTKWAMFTDHDERVQNKIKAPSYEVIFVLNMLKKGQREWTMVIPTVNVTKCHFSDFAGCDFSPSSPGGAGTTSEEREEMRLWRVEADDVGLAQRCRLRNYRSWTEAG